MTDENARANAAAELEHARRSLRQARILQQAGEPDGAASRAYFAAFHAARALLFSVGLEAKTHRGVMSLLGQHFVQPGSLPADTLRQLSRMQADRHDADYLAASFFTAEAGAEAIAHAERLLARVRALLSE